MGTNNQMIVIMNFLEKNGYKSCTEDDSEYISYFKEGVSNIDINTEEIVLIGERGDWLHLPYNFYALVGALVYHRQLACDFRE